MGGLQLGLAAVQLGHFFGQLRERFLTRAKSLERHGTLLQSADVDVDLFDWATVISAVGQKAPIALQKNWVKARHAAPTAIGCRSSIGRSLMRRREFIAGIGSAATWQVAARAQQPDRVRRVGVLMAFDETDAEGKGHLSAFTQGLGELGWTDSRNLRMDVAAETLVEKPPGNRPVMKAT